MKNHNVMASVGLAVLLLGLGLLVSRVGGIGIRRSGEELLSLTVASPLMPGIPFQVHWDVASNAPDRSVVLKLRLPVGQTDVAAGTYQQGKITATLPCDAAAGAAGVVLAEAASNRVLGQQEVTILPVGPDCLR